MKPSLVAAFLATLTLGSLGASTNAEPPKKSEPRLFVAVGYGGRRMSSHDGQHWEHDTQWAEKGGDDDNVLFNVAYGKGRFVAVGGARLGRMVVTRDGKTWTELPQQRGRVATIAFGKDRFVAGHGHEFLISSDGENWRKGAQLNFRGSLHFRKSAFGNGRFVAIGDCDPPGERRISFRAVTREGDKVEHFATGTPTARAIAFGAGRFVVVGPDGLRESSRDGVTWEHTVKEPGENLHSLVWTGERFLVGGGKHAYTSADGINWMRESKGDSVQCALCRQGTVSRRFLGRFYLEFE